ncbi:unnamed protein product, partial [marine sediment metagenome]
MSYTVTLPSMKPRIDKNDFPDVSRRRVMLKNRTYIRPDTSNKTHQVVLPSKL